MNLQKFDVKVAAKLNQVSQNPRAFQPRENLSVINQFGMTLLETMVTMGIASIVALGAATLMTWSTSQFQIAIQKNQVQETILWASYQLRGYLGQAINIGDTKSPGSNLDCSASTANPSGCIVQQYNTATASANYRIITAGAHNGTVDTLARFYREAGIGAGDVKDTAIYFKRPDASTPDPRTGVYPPGVLYFASADVGGDLLVGPENLFYENIVSISMSVDVVNDALAVPPAVRPKSATIIITARSHNSSRRSDWRWCGTDYTAAPIAPIGCGGQGGSKDEVATVNINFRNNLLRFASATGDPCGDRLYGCMYFYKNVLPFGLNF